MLQAPFNNLIVKVDTKYIRNISNIMKLSSIQKESTLKPADCVNLIGEVVSIPKKISGERQYEGYSTKDIQVGDKAILSHMVIFSFIEQGANEDPIYRNMFYYKGEEYFLCNIQNLFGVIRNNEVIMVNGNTMVFDFPEKKIILSAQTKRKISTTESELMHIGNPKENEPFIPELKPNDTIYFNQNKVTKYQIGGKPICILNQSHILGKADVTG